MDLVSTCLDGVAGLKRCVILQSLELNLSLDLELVLLGPGFCGGFGIGLVLGYYDDFGISCCGLVLFCLETGLSNGAAREIKASRAWAAVRA